MIFNNIVINPSFILYFVGTIAILSKMIIQKINIKLIPFSKIILFLGLGYVTYYTDITLNIDDNFLSSKQNFELYNNRYVAPILYFLYFIGYAAILFDIKAQNNKIFSYYFYIASAVGAITSGNLFVAFVYLEVISILSIIIILTDTKRQDVGMAYVIVHCISGVLMMVGVVGYILNSQNIGITSSVNFTNVVWVWKIPELLFLIGLLMNLGVPPFSYIITECYTIIDSFSAVILSTVSTKIYLLFFINTFFGIDFLYIIGGIMIVYSGICAIINSDLRRIINHWMILHLGVIISFCASDNSFNHNSLGFVLFMNMIAMFCVSVCVGILYDLHPEYVRNISHDESNYSMKNKILKCLIIFFLIANIIGLPFTVSFFADVALYSNNNIINILHMIGQFFCCIIGTKIIAESLNSVNKKVNNLVHYKMINWIILAAITSIMVVIIIANIYNIFDKYLLDTFHIDYKIFIIEIIICLITYYLISIKSIKIGGKFGFDLIWIYERILIPLFKIIKIFVITMHDFGNKIIINILQIIYKKYIVINNEYIEKNIFYNKNSIWALSIFIFIIIISVIINV